MNSLFRYIFSGILTIGIAVETRLQRRGVAMQKAHYAMGVMQMGLIAICAINAAIGNYTLSMALGGAALVMGRILIGFAGRYLDALNTYKVEAFRISHFYSGAKRQTALQELQNQLGRYLW